MKKKLIIEVASTIIALLIVVIIFGYSNYQETLSYSALDSKEKIPTAYFILISYNPILISSSGLATFFISRFCLNYFFN